ncbi:MAG: ice-binding family protein, partial [Chloroflexota bacterium]|nr:ice-binding family protein [Chloroflexota bacterium]
ATVGLGTARNFAVLAGETITNSGLTTITGDVGLHPGSAVTGFGPGADEVTLNGSLHEADGVAQQAKVHLVTAYNEAAGRSATEIPTELGGTLLPGGVYDSASGTFGITGTLTLDGADDPDAVFIFQMGTTLISATDSSVELINGADPCNVFWQVGSSATLGTGSSFQGTILALTTIELGNAVTVDGRLLARNGEVTLIGDTITMDSCAAGPAPTNRPGGGTPPNTASEPPTSVSRADGTVLYVLLLAIAAAAMIVLGRPRPTRQHVAKR